VGSGARQLAFDGTTLWLTCSGANVVLCIDPLDRSFQAIPIANNPWGICYAGDYIIVSSMNGLISKINPRTNIVVDSEQLSDCSWLCHNYFDGTNVWITDNANGNVRVIIPDSLDLANTFEAPEKAITSCSDGKYQWVVGENSVTVMKYLIE